MVGHAGFEPALFLNPNQVPYQARRMTVNQKFSYKNTKERNKSVKT